MRNPWKKLDIKFFYQMIFQHIYEDVIDDKRQNGNILLITINLKNPFFTDSIADAVS